MNTSCQNTQANSIPLIEVTEISDLASLRASVSLQNIEALINQSSQESSKEHLSSVKNILSED